MDEREQLEQAIAQLEAQRAILGDGVVDASIAALHEKLAALEPTPVPEQRKQATILCADVSGFTAMSEAMDAEEVSDMMNALWQRLDAAIVEHGGVIDKHMGDGVMALWGVEEAREDDPEQAIRAALAMQAQVGTFGAERQVELAMRVGLNTGPVLLGAVVTTGEFSAIGDAVNLASRLEGAAPTGGVLISHDTYRHVRGVFDVLEQEPLRVKGKIRPVQTYLVQRARPRAFRMATRGVAGIETRMVGRDAELLMLQNMFHDATEDAEVHVVTIVGEAGVGKSRLLYEFEKWVELLPGEIGYFKGRAAPETQAMLYGLVRRMFAHRFAILESDSTAEVREKFRAGMAAALGPNQADLVGQLIGFDFSTSPAVLDRLGSESFAELATAHLIEYLRAIASEPTVILLEDIHWADDSSLDLLDYLATAVPDTRLLVVCLARPPLFERRPSWGEGQEIHTQINLKPLSRRASRALVGEILQRAEEVPRELRDLIVEGAEGNPFYVEELIRMLIEDGVIVRGEKRWRIELERLAEVRVPPTLTGILQARLDGLPREEKTVLQQASVVGRLFWGAVVAELASDKVEAAQVDQLLDDVRNRELIFQREYSVFETTNEYIFKHALLRDVTYETVLLKLRRVYHAQVARWLESAAGERVSEYLSVIARHYELAGEMAVAVEWYGQAGNRAVKLSANEEAVGHFSRGLELLKTLPDNPEHTGQELGLQVPLAVALMNLKGYSDPEVGRAFTRAHELCDQIGETPQIAVALFGLCAFYFARAEYRLSIKLSEQVLRIAPKTQDPSTLLLIGHNSMAGSFSMLGESKQALMHAEQALDIYDPQQHRPLVFLMGQDSKANCMSLVAHNLWLRGYPDQAIKMSRDALAFARELAHPHTLSLIHFFANTLCHFCRDVQTLRELTEEWLAHSTEYGFLLFIGNATIFRGWSLVEQGQPAEGIAEMRQGLALLGSTGAGAFRSYCLTMLAEAHRKAGQPEQGLAALDEALGWVEKTDERFYEAEIHRLRGELLLVQSADEAKVEGHYKQAIEVARQLDAKSLELRAVMSLSRLWQKQGKQEQARQMLGEIYGWFTEGFDTANLQEAKALLDELA